MSPRSLGALVALLLTALPAQARDLSDHSSLEVAYAVGEPVSVDELLASWGRAFDALVLVDPALSAVQVRFLTPLPPRLTWGTVKQLLAFHEVEVRERAPQQGDAPGAPWIIEAVARRNAANTPPIPRLVPPGVAPAGDEVVTAVFPVRHGAGATIFATLRQLASRLDRHANVVYVQGPELVLAVDLASRVRYYARLVAALDVAGPQKELRVYAVRHAQVERLAELVTGVLRAQGGGGSGGGPVRPAPTPGGGGPEVLPDPRTRRLAVVALPFDLPLVERVIDTFDVPKAGPPDAELRVYRCQHARAEELAARLREVFAASGGGAPAPAGAAAPAAPEQQGPGQEPVQVVAAPETESLLITATPRGHREALRVLAEVDRRPPRVLIEVLVWEVATPTDQLTVGVELAGLTNAHEDSTRPAAATSFGLSDLAPVTGPDGRVVRLGRTPRASSGLTAVLTRDAFDKLPILLSMAHTFERSHLVTRSITAVDDGKKASFSVANTQPFIVQQVSNGVISPSVNNASAETRLEVTPRVHPDRSLTLEVSLTLSSFSGSGSVELPPGTNSRAYTGEAITVADGSYAVFGGMEAEREDEVEEKVPLLGDIPILGHLFKRWRRSRSRSRLYVFIRPTVFAPDSFAAEARLADRLRARAHTDAGRAPWLPALVQQSDLRAGYTLQDEAFAVFGTGSASPFD